MCKKILAANQEYDLENLEMKWSLLLKDTWYSDVALSSSLVGSYFD